MNHHLQYRTATVLVMLCLALSQVSLPNAACGAGAVPGLAAVTSQPVHQVSIGNDRQRDPIAVTNRNVLQLADGSHVEAVRWKMPATAVAAAEDNNRLTEAEARARAKLLHETYEATLQAIHRRYFRDDAKLPVPSRVLEEVFSDVARRSKVKARWIAVNAPAMSLDHEPQDEFEKQAARILASGKEEYERVENGTYRRAAAITLFASCLKCHAPPPLRPDVHRVAGLAISVPLKTESAEAAMPLLDFGGRPLKIVCLGDSVTGVYYHTGGRRAYPEMLELALQKVHPNTTVTVINAGISGHTTQNGLDRLQRDVLSQKPDLVAVSFGLNDMTRIAPEQFRKSLDQIVARCRAANSKVLLCTPNAVINTAGRPTEKLVQYCDVIRSAGRDLGVPVCDQYATADALRRRDAWAWRLTMSDEIHPNMDGHKRMARELCRAITGTELSLDDVGPPVPVLPRTQSLLQQTKPVRVLAMPPYDALIGPALKQLHESAQVEVTVWPVAGKSLAELERAAGEKVRAMKPDLVLVAVPREAAAESDEQFVRSYSWILNWSLSFGQQEWDCVVIHASVSAPGVRGPRDDLMRRLVRAQDLHLIDRAPDNETPANAILLRWLRDRARMP